MQVGTQLLSGDFEHSRFLHQKFVVFVRRWDSKAQGDGDRSGLSFLELMTL